MAKFEKQLFNKQKYFWHDTSSQSQYIYIVNAKYQKPSVKALVQTDFPVYAHAKSSFKANRKKWLISQSCYFVQKIFLGNKLLHANVHWVYIV